MVNTTRKIGYVLQRLGFNMQDFYITRRTKEPTFLTLFIGCVRWIAELI